MRHFIACCLANAACAPDDPEMDTSDGGQTRKICVLVAASQASFAASLRHDLERLGFCVCAAARDASGAVSAAVSEEPDLCVLGVDLPGSAVLATAQITDLLPRTRVVILAAALDEEDCLTYLQAGASGYLEDTGRDCLAALLRAAAAGQAVLPPAAQQRLLDALRGDHL